MPKRKPRIVEIRQTTTGGYPSLWEGLSETGRPVYVRDRWNILTVNIDGEQVFRYEYFEDEQRDTETDTEWVIRLTSHVIDWDLQHSPIVESAK